LSVQALGESRRLRTSRGLIAPPPLIPSRRSRHGSKSWGRSHNAHGCVPPPHSPSPRHPLTPSREGFSHHRQANCLVSSSWGEGHSSIPSHTDGPGFDPLPRHPLAPWPGPAGGGWCPRCLASPPTSPPAPPAPCGRRAAIRRKIGCAKPVSGGDVERLAVGAFSQQPINPKRCKVRTKSI